ncbi:MAG TPA: ABC transporter permease [Acidimicrobiales bacterium]|nr:ABC transporter permease [Acidimicrobiales bacterium]
MEDYLRFLLLGLGSGGVIAALGLGLVLTQRASGVVNLGHAAMGMFGAATFFHLRATGELILPFPGLPDHIRLSPAGMRPTFLTALVVTLALSALVGALLDVLVFARLRRAHALARVVASLGLMLFLLAMAGQRFQQGAALLSIDGVLPTASVDVLGVAIPRDRLLLAGLAIVAAGALAATYRFTRFGLATQAAAESEKGALLTGLSPDLLSAANWAIASMLATGATIFIAPITGLAPTTAALLIVPALAAALLGRLDSFAVTVAAGLGIGMVQSATLHFTGTQDWIPGWVPDGGLQQALPFLIILVSVSWAGNRLPTRGDRVERGLPPSPVPRHPIAWTLGLGGLTLVALLTASSDWRLGIIVSMTGALLALSVVVLTGYVGQISLAPLAFAGVAGFVMARLSSGGWPPALALVAGVAASLAVGIVTGLPAVRVRGMTLAIATLAAAVAIEELVLRSSALTGSSGAASVPPLRIGPLDLDVAARGDAFPRVAFGIGVLVVLALAALVVANLRRSPTGLRWLAVRANERAAAAVGIDVARTKLSAFALSSALAGLGGTLLALQRAQLSAESYLVLLSLSLLALTYLGGIASLTGALVAGALTTGGIVTVAGGSADSSQVQFAVTGLALMAATVLAPDGARGVASATAARLQRLRVGRSEVGSGNAGVGRARAVATDDGGTTSQATANDGATATADDGATATADDTGARSGPPPPAAAPPSSTATGGPRA